jgi:hypothetical protein
MQTDSVWKVFAVDVRHMPWAEFEVYADIAEGGGYDDEPFWREVTITDIWSLDKQESAPRRVKEYLIKEYGEYFEQELSDEYDRW